MNNKRLYSAEHLADLTINGAGFCRHCHEFTVSSGCDLETDDEGRRLTDDDGEPLPLDAFECPHCGRISVVDIGTACYEGLIGVLTRAKVG